MVALNHDRIKPVWHRCLTALDAIVVLIGDPVGVLLPTTTLCHQDSPAGVQLGMVSSMVDVGEVHVSESGRINTSVWSSWRAMPFHVKPIVHVAWFDRAWFDLGGSRGVNGVEVRSVRSSAVPGWRRPGYFEGDGGQHVLDLEG